MLHGLLLSGKEAICFEISVTQADRSSVDCRTSNHPKQHSSTGRSSALQSRVGLMASWIWPDQHSAGSLSKFMSWWTSTRQTMAWTLSRYTKCSMHSTAQHSTAQHSTAQHSTAQHSTAQHSTAQHSTAQHSTAQHSTAQHSTAQRSAAQHM